MTQVLANHGVVFESNNPITHLMTDVKSGDIQKEILNEKILSAIVEIKTNIDEVSKILEIVHNVNETIDTVTAVGVSTRCDEKGDDNVLAPMLEDLGFASTA